MRQRRLAVAAAARDQAEPAPAVEKTRIFGDDLAADRLRLVKPPKFAQFVGDVLAHPQMVGVRVGCSAEMRQCPLAVAAAARDHAKPVPACAKAGILRHDLAKSGLRLVKPPEFAQFVGDVLAHPQMVGVRVGCSAEMR
nr:hypothetical protein [Candidatus Rhodoblastus alkanivorans]